MAFKLNVSTDTAALGRKLNQSVNRYPKAAAAGINRAAQSAFTFAVREIQTDIGATSQKTIRRNLTLEKATGEKPEAQLIGYASKKERVPIFEMKPRPRTITKRRPPGGVRYGATSKLIPGSFIARMRSEDNKSEHVGVFKRIGTFSIKTRREMIAELFGPSVARVFARRRIKSKVMAFIGDKLPGEINRAFRFAKV